MNLFLSFNSSSLFFLFPFPSQDNLPSVFVEVHQPPFSVSIPSLQPSSMAGRPSDSAGPNNNGNNYSHPSLPIQDYTSYPSPSRMAAVLQTLSPEVSHFHNPSPMTPYPESVDLSSSGVFLYTTPQHQQQQSYMSSDLGVHMRSYNQDIRYYPTPLSNGPTETFNSFEDISRMIGDNFTGAQDVAPSFDQPVTGPGGSESGNPLSHARSLPPFILFA